MKPFLGRADSGMLDVAFNPTLNGNSYGTPASYGMKNMSKDTSSASRSGSHAKPWPSDKVNYKATVTGQSPWSNRTGREGDGRSVESTASDQMIIRQTTDLAVQYDETQPDLPANSAKFSM